MKRSMILLFSAEVLLAACTQPEVNIDRITLNPSSVILAVGETSGITVNFLSGKTEDVLWYSGDESVATVSGGTIKAVGRGITSVMACTAQSGLLAECEVTVRSTDENVTGIVLSDSEFSLYLGEFRQVKADVLPSTAANKAVLWSSSDNSVATVGNSGYVYSTGEGMAVITATTAEGGFSASCNVTVLPAFVHVESISIQDELYIKVGESVTLVPVILPENATDQSVVWHSYDESIVTVSQDGVVTGTGPGTMYVDVTANDGGLKYKCYVSVYE